MRSERPASSQWVVNIFGPVALIAQLLAVNSASAHAHADAAALEPVGAIVEREIHAGRIPGAVVVIGHQGRVVYRGAFGDRALQPRRQPMTDDTIFDLASLTKVVATTTAVMQLVERGKLALDDPVARYWPKFADQGKGPITVRQLLTHYSGLRPDLDAEGGWWSYASALARLSAEKPVAPPGTRFIYSDVNFEVLGELVRRISGQSLDQYCREHIFKLLGMNHTGFTPSPAERDLIATTISGRDSARRGQVHDPTAYRMGGVSGHAGLFSTANDLATFAQMMLDGGSTNGVRILNPPTVLSATTPQNPPGAPVRRGLGWDLDSPLAAAWHAQLGQRSYGHTGYTGTSLWIDPTSRTYVIILSNRTLLGSRGDARPLRRGIAALVGRTFEPATPQFAQAERSRADDRQRTRRDAEAGDGPHVATGVDVLAVGGFAPLVGLRVGLITNHTGSDSAGRRTIDLVRSAPGVKLVAIFSPEHGLGGNLDRKVVSGREPTTGLPLYSLYGTVRRPTPKMLQGLDALVFDVQDVGVRFYTYITTMAYAMEAAAHNGLRFYVLDRPDPISAAVVQGPILDDDLKSFTGYFPLPVRYGMTAGELARMFNAENRIGADLHVIEMRGYHRTAWYDETGLRWVSPSPNLRSLREATLYPAVALMEGANVSVGRGTATPFELLGAPWIDGQALAAYLNQRNISGVRFEPTDFISEQDPFKHRRCHGVRIVLVDRDRLDAPALGVELASALYRLYPQVFEIDSTLDLIGARWVIRAIKSGEDPRAIVQRWTVPMQSFLKLRAHYLLYE